jgi:hypothetical protein
MYEILTLKVPFIHKEKAIYIYWKYVFAHAFWTPYLAYTLDRLGAYVNL